MGQNVVLSQGVTLGERVRIGHNVTLHDGVRVGGRPARSWTELCSAGSR